MAILSEHVEAYHRDLRAERSPVMAEMEALAEQEGVPIVHWETGRMLAALCQALDPVVLEVGTAIGLDCTWPSNWSGVRRSRSSSIRTGQPRRATSCPRAGVAERIRIVEGDARETIPSLGGPFDLLFVDGTKVEYRDYIELAEPKLSERALLVVDNLLMSGEVGLPEGADTFWSAENLAAART